MSDPNLSSFIWSVADLLRGDYKQSEYGKVILPFTVLRRLDCVLDDTKVGVLAELEKRTKAGLTPESFLLRKSGQHFFNTSPLDMKLLVGDQDNIKENLFAYMQAFSPAVRDIFESFDFHTQIDRLAKSGLLYLVCEKFANIDLHPETVSNAQMGNVFEELSPEQIEEITRLFGNCKKVTKGGVPISRIFKNEDFGYHTITVERPERDAAGNVVKATKGKLKGKPQPDASLRDTENVPLGDDVETYFEREVLPHAADAWIVREKYISNGDKSNHLGFGHRTRRQ